MFSWNTSQTFVHFKFNCIWKARCCNIKISISPYHVVYDFEWISNMLINISIEEIRICPYKLACFLVYSRNKAIEIYWSVVWVNKFVSFFNINVSNQVPIREYFKKVHFQVLNESSIQDGGLIVSKVMSHIASIFERIEVCLLSLYCINRFSRSILILVVVVLQSKSNLSKRFSLI